MRGRLTHAAPDGLISPLVDIVFNAMAAMFVFLVIYICIVRPIPKVPLQFTGSDLPEGSWNHGYQTGIPVAGGVGLRAFAIESGALPPGFAFDTETGMIRGFCERTFPLADQSEVFSFTVRVRDDGRGDISRTFALVMRPTAIPFDLPAHPLRVEYQGNRLPDAHLNRPYEAILGIFGGIEPYAVTLTGALPSDLEITGGRLHGVPRSAGRWEFDVAITDSTSGFRSGVRSAPVPGLVVSYSLVVIDSAPLRVHALLPRGRVGEPYRGGAGASGGVPPYTWSEPAGLDGSGLAWNGGMLEVTGTPTGVSKLSVGLRVQDSTGASVESAAEIEILPAMPRLSVATHALPDARAGRPYSLTLAGEGGTQPYAWSLVTGASLPRGLQLSGDTIQGVPEEAGSHRIEVTLTDCLGAAISKRVELRVRPPMRALAWEGTR